MCFWVQTKDGKKVPWGNVPYSKLYEPDKGWCEADKPEGEHR